MPVNNVEGLFEEELKDLYDAEKQLVKALPKMAKAAESEELRQGFEEHLEATKGHVARLEQVFESIEVKPKGKACEAMKGLVAEGQEAVDEKVTGNLRDILLIGAARRVEHYEMAAYQTAIQLADSLGNDSAVELLRQTLSEEEETDQKLDTLCAGLLETLASSTQDQGSGEERGATRKAASGSSPDKARRAG